MSEAKKEKKPFFKKWWFWAIIVVVIIAVAVSGEEEGPELVNSNSNNDAVPVATQPSESTNEPEDESEPDPGPVEQEFGINDAVKLGDHVLTVTEVEMSEGTQFDKPKDGQEYVIVTVKIENNGDDNISYNPLDFKMSNSNGQIERQSFTIVDSDTSLSSGELSPGGNVSGTIVFEQPKDDPELKLIFEPSFWSRDQVVVNLN